MDAIFLDAETYPTRSPSVLAEVAHKALASRPAHNTAKSLKERWDTPEGERARVLEAVAKTGLDVVRAEVLCVAVATMDSGPDVLDGTDPAKGERRVMAKLAEALWECGPETIWVGHNHARYDLPLFLNRWRAHGITPPPHYPRWTGSRWIGRVYDTMQHVPSGNGFVSMAAACALVGIEGKSVSWLGEPMNGARVAAAWDAGEYDLICEYCAQDVADNRALFRRLTFDGQYGCWQDGADTRQTLTEIQRSEVPPAFKVRAYELALQAAGLLGA